MTFQQLEYIVALAEHGSFTEAAEACRVSQPALSTQVKTLERELNMLIFDRTTSPISPTPDGAIVLNHAREIISMTRELKGFAHEMSTEIKGTLRLGVIPTVASSLLPVVLRELSHSLPEVMFEVAEMRTDTCVNGLKRGDIDLAIAATPLGIANLLEEPLYWEPFLIYAAEGDELLSHRTVRTRDVPHDRLWVMEEGHCLRTQIAALCETTEKEASKKGFRYAAGSIETLCRLVDTHGGLTVIPGLYANAMPQSQRDRIRPFATPSPVREVSVLVHKGSPWVRAIPAIRTTVRAAVPEDYRLRQRAATIPPPTAP